MTILSYPFGQNAVDELMLTNDKLFVVLAVVLIIWIGLALYIFLTDKRIRNLEKMLENLEKPVRPEQQSP